MTGAANLSSHTGGWYISLGIYIFVFICVSIGALLGLRRGAPKSIVRIITVVASAVGAFLLTSLIMNAVSSFFDGKTLEEAIRTLYPNYDAFDEGLRSIIACFDIETAEYILMIPLGAVISPIIFVTLFVILALLMLIVYKIFTAIFKMVSYRKGALSTGLGAAIGAVQGIFVAAVILLPLSGLSGVAADVRSDLIAEEVPDNISEPTEEFYCNWLDDVSGNIAVKAIRVVGGDATYSALTRVRIGEEHYKIRETLPYLGGIYRKGIALKEANWTQLSAEDKANIDEVVSLACQDEYSAGLISGLLRGASSAVEGDAIHLEMEDPYRSLIITAVHVFSDIDNQSLHGVARTLANSYYIVSDSGALKALGGEDKTAILDTLTKLDGEGRSIMTNLTAELNSNPRTAPITTALTKLSLAVMSQSLNVGDETIEIYESVKTEINNILIINKEDYQTEEEYTEAVGEQLNTALVENGIQLEKEIIDDMAGYIAENYSDVDEVTDEDINMAILYYYDAYAKYLEDGKFPSDLPIQP